MNTQQNVRYLHNKTEKLSKSVYCIQQYLKEHSIDVEVDQVFDALSKNPQSGVAIAEALINNAVGFEGVIDLSTSAPKKDGIFIPQEEGVYDNFGGLEFTLDDGFTMFYKQGDSFIKQSFPSNIKTTNEVQKNSDAVVTSSAVEKYAVKKINTIADLRNTIGEYEGQVVELLSYRLLGDMPSAKFQWLNSGWQIIHNGELYLSQFDGNLEALVNSDVDRFIIDKDVDLNKTTININGSLIFKGGVISNGVLNGDFTIESDNVKIFDNIQFLGNSRNNNFLIDWFVGNYETTLKYQNPKNATIEIQQAFYSGVSSLKFDNTKYYYINQTLILNSTTALIGTEQTFTLELKDTQTTPCIYTDTDKPIIEVIIDSGEQTGYSAPKIDNIYIRRDYDFTDYNDLKRTYSIPNVLIHNSSISGRNQAWGVDIKVHILNARKKFLVGDTNVDCYGFTGVKILCDNNGVITFVRVDGNIFGVYEALKVAIDGGRWVTDVTLSANTYCTYAADVDASPFIIYGSHQPAPTILKGDRESFFKSTGKVVNYGQIWDIRDELSLITPSNAIVTIESSSYINDYVSNKSPLDTSAVMPYDAKGGNRSLEDIYKSTSIIGNTLESAFLKTIGNNITSNSSSSLSFTNLEGSVDVYLKNSNNEKLQLNNTNVLGYQFLFKISSSWQPNLSTYGSTSRNLSLLRDNVSTNFNRYFVEFSIERKRVASTMQNSYLTGFTNSFAVNILIEYVNSSNAVIESKQINLQRERLFYPKMFCRNLDINYNRTDYTTLRITFSAEIDSTSVNGRTLPKFGIQSFDNSNIITSSGGEIVGRTIFDDVVLTNHNSLDRFTYYHNEYLNKYVAINQSTYTPLLSLVVNEKARFVVHFKTLAGIEGSFTVLGSSNRNIQNIVKGIGVRVDELTSANNFKISFLAINGNSTSVMITRIDALKPIQFNSIDDSIIYDINYGTELRYYGTTSQRPILDSSNYYRGYQYFDTTLSKMVVWNGTLWIEPLTTKSDTISSTTTADATDLATALTLVNELKAKNNDLLAKLKAAGIMNTI